MKRPTVSQTHAPLPVHLDPIEQEDTHEEKPMTKTPRWIQSAIAETENCTARMPWERGLRRQAFIASRRAVAVLAQSGNRTMRPAA